MLSRRFWAWAGAWDPQPITPIFLMPLKASGSNLYLSRPAPVDELSVISKLHLLLLEHLGVELQYCGGSIGHLHTAGCRLGEDSQRAAAWAQICLIVGVTRSADACWI